jgi:hypothetical protein
VVVPVGVVVPVAVVAVVLITMLGASADLALLYSPLVPEA